MADLGEETSLSADEGRQQQSPSGSERLACLRCRQRKVKCNRAVPCSHCIKAGTQCSYAAAPKLRERRQRVMVSNTYDSKLDTISRKIDELSCRMSRLSHSTNTNTTSTNTRQEEHSNTSSFETPDLSSFSSTPNSDFKTSSAVSGGMSDLYHTPAEAEFEGESSLFAHARFASRFLQDFIDTTTNPEETNEMEVVLHDLRTALHPGKQESGTLDKLYPRANNVPPGQTTRNLPLPPMDKTFLCLRMARESSQVAMLWLADFIKPSQFNDYFIKVVSPGPATEADLIIVHCGLCWLFHECSKIVPDEGTRHDYVAQALLCEANLETVLSNLRFHQAVNIDVAYAMSLAALYCLQKSRPSTAWTFINTAAQTIQALGLHHNRPASVPESEDEAQKRTLFWTVYMTEKTLSLTLGRSSIFRDQDITLNRPSEDCPSVSTTLITELTPSWVNMASIQGRIYDDIYSPGALTQPLSVRTSRARALAAELEAVMQQTENIHNRHSSAKGEVMGLPFHDVARQSDRVIGYCMLTLVFRSIPAEKPATSAFCQKCIDFARKTLKEHERCVASLVTDNMKTIHLEAYLHYTILQSPFIPFIILFCHVIETSEGSDLKYMRCLLDSLELASDAGEYSTCHKQLRLFRALCQVAEKYIEVKSRPGNSRWLASTVLPHTGQQYDIRFSRNPGEPNSRDRSRNSRLVGEAGILPGARAQHEQSDWDVAQFANGQLVPVLGDEHMEMDLSGTQLWDWFNQSQSIMRILEDP